MGLSFNQRAAVELIAAGAFQHDAAQTLRIPLEVLRSYLKQPEFVEALRERQEQLAQETVNAWRGTVNRALQVVQRQLDSSDPRIAFKAAKYILDKVPPDILKAELPALPPESLALDADWEAE